MRDNIKKWIVNYMLDSENTGISIIQMIAMKEFEEEARFSEKEAEEYKEFLRSRKVPEFKDRILIGDLDLGLSYREWYEFVEENEKEYERRTSTEHSKQHLLLYKNS